MPTPIQLFSTDPSTQSSYLDLQNRQAIAQALMQQGLTPDNSSHMAGGVAYRVSPLEGLTKVLQAYAGQKMMSGNNQAMGSLLAQYNQQLQGMMGGQAPQQPNDAVSGALAQGAASGSVGPTNDNAQRLAAALKASGGQAGVTPPSTTGVAPPQNAPAGPSPMNPTGMPPQLAAYSFQLDPAEYTKTVMSQMAPTEIQRQAMAAGYKPGTPGYQSFMQDYLQKQVQDPGIRGMQQAGFTPQQIYAAKYGEAAKAADITRRPEQSFLNPFMGSSGITPKIPEGSNPVGGLAANGALPGGVAPMPGAAPIMQQNAQAGATGSANGGFQSVTMPDGSQRPIRGAEVPAVAPQAGVQGKFVGDPASIAAQIGNIPDPQERANAMAALQQQVRSEGNPLKLGQSTAGKAIQEEAGKTLAALPQQVTQTKQTITGLENALTAIQALQKSGPGVSKAVNAVAILNNMGVPVEKGDVNGYQTLKKYIENAAASAAASGGFTGSDARFEQFKAGQPNAETMNPQALEGALRYVLSQQDAALNQGSYLMNQGGSDASKVQQAKQAWAQQYNPRYFEMQRLAPDAQRAAVNAMSPQQAASFLAWRKSQKGM